MAGQSFILRPPPSSSMAYAIHHDQEGLVAPPVISSTSAPKPPRKRIRRLANEPHRRRGRPAKNPCWFYFQRLPDRNVQCMLCSQIVRTACATNMTKHLERHHKMENLGSTQISDLPFAPLDLPDQPSVSSQWVDSLPPSSFEFPSNRTEYSEILQVPLGMGPYDMNMIRAWPHVAEPSSSAAGPLRRNRKTTHPVWSLFQRTSSQAALCSICGAAVRSPCASNCMGHLRRHHADHHKDIYARWLNRQRVERDPVHMSSSSLLVPRPLDFMPTESPSFSYDAWEGRRTFHYSQWSFERSTHVGSLSAFAGYPNGSNFTNEQLGTISYNRM